MDPVRWTPLGTNRPGLIAVSTAASVSLAFIAAFSSWVAYLLIRHHAREKKLWVEHETRAVRFLASSHGILLGSLIIGDLLQALGFALSWHWLRRGALPAPAYPTSVCTTQAVLIQVGDLGSAFSSLIICINLLLILVFRISPALRWLLTALAFMWTCIFILAAVGPLWRIGKGGVPFYGPAGMWCWIESSYSLHRLAVHYVFVFIVGFLDLLLYSIIAIYLRHHHAQMKGQSHLSSTANISRAMMLYPLVYVATILPLSIFRCASMAGRHWSIHILAGCGAVFTLSGMANTIIYALTRKLVSFDVVTSKLRRGSGSGSGGSRGDAVSYSRRGSGATFTQASLPATTKSRHLRGILALLFSNSDTSRYRSESSTGNGNGFEGIVVEVETTKAHDQTPAASPDLGFDGRHAHHHDGSRRLSKPEVRWDLETALLEDRPFGQLEPRDSLEMSLSRTPSTADRSDKS